MKWVWSRSEEGFHTKVNLDRIDNIIVSLDYEKNNIIAKAWAGEGGFTLDKFPILNRSKEAIDAAFVRAKKYVNELTE